MKALHISLLISIMAFSILLPAQDTCFTIKRIQTEYLSNGFEKLKFPLNFFISQDSIMVSPDSLGKKEFMYFEILNKKCDWSTGFSKGSTTFLLKIEDMGVAKYPKLVINFLNPFNKIIELLYENLERREFNIISYDPIKN